MEANIQLLSIYQQVCERFKMKPHYESVRVRQVAHYVAFKRVPTSKRLIGYVIGQKNYKTVEYSIKHIEDLIEPIRGRVQDEELKQDIEMLLK